ncbi:hypothetical protein TIFTF001_025851 [Ficus carica]|uniref:Uncharacterized protein n=1 Tax=Ficus carica TaxID=3494 RepID=A0AA88ARG4_FICCA|nr:hypothetical protein TIFTF001_025851 [Ficus carica]
MAVASRTRSMLENLVREGSFKWLLGHRSSFDEEFEEMGKSPSAQNNWIPELSPIANIIVRRCSKILGVPATELKEKFNAEASDSSKHPTLYARNFLEYCCFRTLALSIQVDGYLADKKFRRLTYDMMIGWEAPAAPSEPSVNVDVPISVGIEAFSRIAPAVPIISNVIISENLFEVLTASNGGRLQFSIYDKYLIALERAMRKMKTQSDSSLLSVVRLSKGEKILEVDGTVTTQPVLEHVGISTWPGRLILTDHAIYFEALLVVSYDTAKRYDLSGDLKQVVKPELTGPWGTRLFDKAVFYKSTTLSEPVTLEFPELKGHTRRDYWLAIIREILFAHRFINKFQIKGVERDKALSKAVLGIVRLQAIQDISLSVPLNCEVLLMFNLCDQLPGGDSILETLGNMLTSRESDQTDNSQSGSRMSSSSALDMVSNFGFVFGTSSNNHKEDRLVIGELTVGKMTSLERAVKKSKTNYEKVVVARATIDGVKVDGIDKNLAVMKELVFPVLALGQCLFSLAYWENPLQSFVFCSGFTYIIYRQWLGYSLALFLLSVAIFMVLTRLFIHGNPVVEVTVFVPPPMNRMEQLLAVQNAISHAEGVLQDGAIVLLKIRALILSMFPQASMKFGVALLLTAMILAFLPNKYIVLLLFLETFTRYSPPRKASTERWMRRLREWWFSIPAAPVVIEREEDKKKT